MKIKTIELYSDKFTDIVNHNHSVEINIKIVDRVVHVIINGATSKKDFLYTFLPFYFYSRRFKAWCHFSTWLKFQSIEFQVWIRLMNQFHLYDEICICGFSQGAATGLFIKRWLERVMITKKITYYFEEPYRSIAGAEERVFIVKNSFANRWPLVKGWKNPVIVRAPYHWWQIRKNHFYLLERARG